MPQRKVYREGQEHTEVDEEVRPTFEEAKKERLEKVEEMLVKYKNSELSMGLIESSIATIVFVPLSCFNSFEKSICPHSGHLTHKSSAISFGVVFLIFGRTISVSQFIIYLSYSLSSKDG